MKPALVLLSLFALSLLLAGCLNPTVTPTPEPNRTIVVPPVKPTDTLADKLAGLDFVGLGRSEIAASCIETDTDPKTGVTEKVPITLQGDNTRLELTQESNGKKETTIMIVLKNQVLVGGSVVTDAGSKGTPNADPCVWVKVDVPKGTSVAGPDENPAAAALSALKTLPAKDFECHPTIVTEDTFHPKEKTCTPQEFRDQQTPTLPTAPWPNGATTVMELTQTGKPYECSQRALITGPQGLDGHLIIFIYGTRLKETFRANINNALYDDEDQFVDGATLYSQVGQGTPTCHWTSQYQPTLNGQTLSSFSDFVSTVTPDTFTCVLSHINGIPLPRPGDPCPV